MISTVISLIGVQGTTTVSSTPTPPATSNNQVNVYLLTGQSNMQGIGDVNQLPSDNPLRYTLNSVFIWNHVSSANKLWEKYSAGFNQQYNLGSNAGGSLMYGPEGSFGYHMAQATGKPVYIIKLGYGGATLGTTGGSRIWSKPSNDLFPIYINEYVYAAIAALQAQGLQPVIKGHFRYQGENDANGQYSSFQTLREQFSTDLKAALGLTTLREIETRLHSGLNTTNYNVTGAQAVRDAQTAFVNTDTVNRKLLTVDECTMNADITHLDGSLTGQWLVGKKAAQLAAQWEGVTIN